MQHIWLLPFPDLLPTLVNPHTFIDLTFLSLFCLVTHLSLTRNVRVAIGFEQSVGAWWAHFVGVTEDKVCLYYPHSCSSGRVVL